MAPLTTGRVLIGACAIYQSKVGLSNLLDLVFLHSNYGRNWCQFYVVNVCIFRLHLNQIALATAIRYGLSRRAFAMAQGEPEVLLLDYPSHQQRLLTLLAKTWVYVVEHCLVAHFGQLEMMQKTFCRQGPFRCRTEIWDPCACFSGMLWALLPTSWRFFTLTERQLTRRQYMCCPADSKHCSRGIICELLRYGGIERHMTDRHVTGSRTFHSDWRFGLPFVFYVAAAGYSMPCVQECLFSFCSTSCHGFHHTVLVLEIQQLMCSIAMLRPSPLSWLSSAGMSGSGRWSGFENW